MILLPIKAQTGLGTTANYPMGTYASVPTIYNEFIQKYIKKQDNEKYKYNDRPRDVLADNERSRQGDVNRKAYRDTQAGDFGWEKSIDPWIKIKNIWEYSNENHNI